MKKIFVLLACIMIVALPLFGCSNSGTSEKKSSSAEPVDLELVDSGYIVTSHGYVEYAVKIKNPNAKYTAQYPALKVVGKDASGNIVFSDEWVLNQILPNSESCYANQAGNGETVPSTVEFSVKVDSEKWKKTDNVDSNVYSIANTNFVKGSYSSSITGEITLNVDKKEYASPQLCAVFYDENGKLITGQSEYLFSNLTAGQPEPFEIKLYLLNELPEYSTYEVYANIW